MKNHGYGQKHDGKQEKIEKDLMSGEFLMKCKRCTEEFYSTGELDCPACGGLLTKKEEDHSNGK